MFAYRVSDKFCYVAKQDGVIVNVNKNKIDIEFKDKTTKTIKLGNWSSKEESDSCYKHTVVTNLLKGSKFKHGDTITYDNTMFEVDMFDKSKVVYKPYKFVKMAMVETISTWEDSSAIHKRLSKDLGTVLYKVKSFILDVDTNLLEIIETGDTVNIDTHLYTISNSDVSSSKLDSKSLEILQRLGMNSPKAKYNGIVDKIEVKYYTELEDCSESILGLIKRSDSELVKSTGKKHITGKVDNQYSINGKPLHYGQLEVKFYIEVKVGVEPGDKFVFGLQLKNTVGELMDYNISTANTKDEIDVMFSRRSVSARIVTSPDIQGTTNTLLKQLGKNVVKMYKG